MKFVERLAAGEHRRRDRRRVREDGAGLAKGAPQKNP